MASYSLTEQLAKHLQRPVDDATRARARLHLLDWIACVVGARHSDVAWLHRRIGPADLTTKLGLLGNVLEMDDVHRTAVLHPGPVIWPLVAQYRDATLDQWLDSAVRGYEAMIAIGATLDAHHYAHFHPTATVGTFGAAAAAASLLDCTSSDTASALGLAGSVTGGLWQMRHEPGMAKQWHVAHAIRTGASVATYAQAGMIGPRFILEGPQGLHTAMCRTPTPMTFPEQWRIHEVSFKPWAACRHAHPAMDAALTLRATIGALDGPIHVATYADAIRFCDRPDPQTEAQAKFSIQHAVAVIASGRTGAPEDFTPDAIAALAPLAAQVTVNTDAAITARYPAHYGATVTCAGHTSALIDTRGDPERPLDQTGLAAKVHSLFAWGGLTGADADRAIDLALNSNDSGALIGALDAWLA